MEPSESRSSITEGGLVRPMFRLAWPIVVIQLLQVTYNIADTLWLGRYSVAAVGALSLAFPVIFLLISVAGGFTTAGSILVAQYTGADSEGSAGRVAGQTVSFVAMLAVGLGIVGYFVTKPLLRLLPSSADTSADIVPLATQYIEIIFLGMVFLFGFFVFSALMRGYGDTKTPMRIMAISVGVNVVLDPLLIFGVWVFPEWGIVGAAVATIFSRGIGTVLGLYVLFFTSRGPDVEFHHLRPDLSIIADIVRLGVPSALEQSASALALVTLTAMVVNFDTPVVAAYGLGNRLASLVFLPAMGLGRATNTMVGQNLGARKNDRAERAVWLAAKVGAGVMFCVAVLAALFPEPLIQVFIPPGQEDAAATIRYGADYIRVRSLEFTFIGVLQVILGAYRGAGNTKTALVFSLMTLWVGRVVPVAALAFSVSVTLPFVGTVSALGMGPDGIWIGMTMGNIVGAVFATAWFTRGTWKKAYIEDDEDGPAEGESIDAGDSDDAPGVEYAEGSED